MKKAVLLLHGFLSDINDFSPLLTFLQNKYDYIEKITYPGHGINDNYHNFNSDDTIKLVEATLTKLETDYNIIDIIGYSMGGAIAVYLASKYQFRKLVLLAPANKYLNIYIPFSKIKHLVVNAYEIEKAFILRKEDEMELYKEKIKTVFEDDLYSLKFLKDKYFKLYFHKAYRNFRNIIELSNNSIGEINNPCFIAWGKLDQLVPKESVMNLYSKCKNENKKLMIYDDLSHLLLLSSLNKQLLSDIEEFLEE